MALLASPFDIFSLLYLCFLSFFFYIEKAKFFSSYWSCFIVKYLSVYEFHLLGFGIIHFWFGFNNLSFSFPLERLVNNSLCFDQFGWCFTHNMYITFFLIRFGEIGRERSRCRTKVYPFVATSNIVGNNSAISQRDKIMKTEFSFVAEFLRQSVTKKKL